MHRTNKNTSSSEYVKYLEKLSRHTLLEEAESVFENIEELQKINSDGAFFNVVKKTQRHQSFKKHIRVLQRFAAVLLLPLFLGSFFYYYYTASSITPITKTIRTPLGVRSKVVLPDSTVAWMNSGSSLSYTEPFIQEERHVSIKGEIFFTVKRDKEHPFFVDAPDIRIKVLGTRFNVKSYSEDIHTEVVLEEGKVNVKGKNKVPENSPEFIMKPGDRVVYNSGDSVFRISHGNIHKYFAWRNEKIVFDQTPMKEAAKILERWYNVKVVIVDKEILKYKFTTTLQGNDLSEVVQLLEMSSPISILYNQKEDRSQTILYIKASN